MKDKYADQLLEEMVDRYASPLLSWAYRKTGSSLEAQDLSQEVLLQVTAAVRRETDRGRAGGTAGASAVEGSTLCVVPPLPPGEDIGGMPAFGRNVAAGSGGFCRQPG